MARSKICVAVESNDVEEIVPALVDTRSEQMVGIAEDYASIVQQTEQIESATGDLDQLQAFYTVMANNIDSGMSDDGTAAIHVATEAICRRLGIKRTAPMLSLEALIDQDAQATNRMAMEENKNIVKRTLEAVWQAIKRLMAFIKDFVQKLFISDKQLDKDFVAAKNAFVNDTSTKEVKSGLVYVGDLYEVGGTGKIIHNVNPGEGIASKVISSEFVKTGGVIELSKVLDTYGEYQNLFRTMASSLEDFKIIILHAKGMLNDSKVNVPAETGLDDAERRLYLHLGVMDKRFSVNTMGFTVVVKPPLKEGPKLYEDYDTQYQPVYRAFSKYVASVKRLETEFEIGRDIGETKIKILDKADVAKIYTTVDASLREKNDLLKDVLVLIDVIADLSARAEVTARSNPEQALVDPFVTKAVSYIGSILNNDYMRVFREHTKTTNGLMYWVTYSSNYYR